jgi:hypothetical protein
MKTNEALENALAILSLIADNGGIASLDDQEARALLVAIEELKTAAALVIDIYASDYDLQEIGGEPLEQALQRLATALDPEDLR